MKKQLISLLVVGFFTTTMTTASEPCKSNADCQTGTEFCALEKKNIFTDKETGFCEKISDYGISEVVNGYIRSNKDMTWGNAQNWCLAQGKKPATRETIGCKDLSHCESPTIKSFKSAWKNGVVWLEDAYFVILSVGAVGNAPPNSKPHSALCY